VPVKSEWHGPEQKAILESEMKRRLTACAILLAGYAKRLVSTAGTGTAGKGKKKKRVYGAKPSAPGDPPAKQTGRLRASITWELSGRTARVGTNLLYGRFLELGTRLMAARPWLRRSLAECADRIRAILSKPLN
jgi:phage gpG-like protein